jgi:ABC-type bacteriocin/lantibiotic exporter with double-glycine peptidase domain
MEYFHAMKEIRHYSQSSCFSCGSAALLIAYDSMGVTYNEVSLAVELGTTKDGTSWEQVITHTEKLGFPVEFKSRATYKDLQKDIERGAIIIAWGTDGNTEIDAHFSVLSGITNDLIELTDPGIPEEEWPSIMSKEEFLNKWYLEGLPRTYLLIKPKKD